MVRKGRIVHSALTRRQFLAHHAAGGIVVAWLLREKSLCADSAASSASEAKGDVVFPLKVSENHRHLADARGKPFFLLGDTPWFLQKLKLDDVRLVLEVR